MTAPTDQARPSSPQADDPPTLDSTVVEPVETTRADPAVVELDGPPRADPTVVEPVETTTTQRVQTQRLATATPAPAPTARRTSRRAPILAVPQQHGAWAFLAVPLLLGIGLAGWSWLGACFAVAWVLAYPASYYLGRAVVIRWRRGEWSRLARRELRNAVPWVAATSLLSVGLVLARPWLLIVGAVLGALWAASVWLTRTGHERGITNDLLLICQAALAVPLLWAVTLDARPPAEAWTAALICLVFFTGSVLHVKSLIRGAGDARWRTGSRVFHVAALSMALISPWLLLPFGAAAVRAFAVPQGTRPGVIGAVETVVSVLVVVCGLLALG